MEYTPNLSKETQKIINGLSGRLRLTIPQTIDFTRQAGETALDAYDDLICELSGGEG